MQNEKKKMAHHLLFLDEVIKLNFAGFVAVILFIIEMNETISSTTIIYQSIHSN